MRSSADGIGDPLFDALAPARRYSARREAVLMIVTPFDERSYSRSFLTAWPDSPGGHPPGDDKKEQAIAQLIEHGVLSHALGQHGEYKVRTTMTTRQTWQYRGCVLRHGKACKGA